MKQFDRFRETGGILPEKATGANHDETTLRQRLLPREALGRAAATWQVAAGLLTPIGALLGALLAETIGLRPTLWILALGFGSAFLWLVAARDTLPGRSDATSAP